MTSESSSGRHDRGPGTEVGLRRLLESTRAPGPGATAQPHPTDHYPTERFADPAVDPETEELEAWNPNAPTGPVPNAPRPGGVGGPRPGGVGGPRPGGVGGLQRPQPPQYRGGVAPGSPPQPGDPAIRAYTAVPQQPRPPRPPAARGGAARPEGQPRSLAALMQHPNARKAGIAAGAVLAAAVLGYAADWFLSSGQVPRGTVVAGVDIGGMDTAKADVILRSELEDKADQPLGLRIDDVRTELVPAAAGLRIDWDGTWERVGDQPLNPFTRLASFFTTREVPVASAVDAAALDAALTGLRVHDIPTVEGTIRFEGTRPVGVPPAQGRVLDGEAARSTLVDNWATSESLDLPVAPAPLTVRPEAVDETLRAVAQPAVSAPITFTGKGGDAALQPDQTAALLTFVPDGNGGLAPVFDIPAATAALAPQLAESEVEPKDASFSVGGGAARVVPAVVGDKVNWAKTLEQLAALAVAAGPGRTGQAIYEKVEPALTTQAAEALRIVEPVGQFTTGGFTGPSGVNIRTVARKVNGAIVKPGETFSLNEFTGPRGTAEGYVESGIIDHGRPSTAVGGGISQFATTLYNAAYFAGLEDAGHTEHSYYISRYPAAREATVFDGAIDLKFRNNTDTGIYIETSATNSEITVRLWGTKTVNVESITGDRTNPTEPTEITLPEGDDCIASAGAPGFTVSDTRVITDANTGQVISRNTRTVKYDPIPIVKCE